MDKINKDQISINDFTKLNLVLGTILEASQNEKAKKPAYILEIDFGQEVGIKKTSAQITNYSFQDLLNTKVVAVTNFPNKNIAGVISEVLVLGAVAVDGVKLLRTDSNVENGTLVG